MSYYPQTPPAPKKKYWPGVVVIVFVVLFIAACLINIIDQPAEKSAGVLPDVTISESVASTGKSAAKPHTVTLTEGTWSVDDEAKPGTYTTTAAGDCYWARLKNFDGELDSIIANGNLSDNERGRITIKASDKGIELAGNCTWTRKP